MKRTKNNRIILLESGNPVARRIARKYEKVYTYSGSFPRGERLPQDFSDSIDHYTSHYRAGEVIDWVYAQYVKKSEAKVLDQIMKDERTHLVIKKTILRALGDLFFSFILAEKFIEKYNIGETIDFIPNEFSYNLYKLLIDRRDLFPQNVNIPQWYVNKMKRREIIKNNIYRMGLIFYPFTLSLLMNLSLCRKKSRKRYHYGVHIWDSWVSSSTSPYRMDFLEDKDGINENKYIIYCGFQDE